MAQLLIHLSDRSLRALRRVARRAGQRTAEGWAQTWLLRVEAGIDHYIRHDHACAKIAPPGPGAQRCTCGLDDAWRAGDRGT